MHITLKLSEHVQPGQRSLSKALRPCRSGISSWEPHLALGSEALAVAKPFLQGLFVPTHIVPIAKVRGKLQFSKTKTQQQKAKNSYFPIFAALIFILS